MNRKVLLILAMICISDALHQSSVLDELDINLLKCANMTGEERKLCRSEVMEEAQFKLQIARLQLEISADTRAQSADTRAQSAEIRAQSAEIRAQSAEIRAQSRDHRENLTFEAAERSLVFPGLTVDPDNENSVLVALISLASFLGFGILNCCRHDSKQPMLIIITFIFIMFTILNMWVLFNESKWVIWVTAAIVMVTIAAIMPIHFMGDGRESYTAVWDTMLTSTAYLLAITIVEVAIVVLILVFSAFPKWLVPAISVVLVILVVLAMPKLFDCLGLRFSIIERAILGGMVLTLLLAMVLIPQMFRL